MSDRLWAGKPPRYVTGHLDQLSLPSLLGALNQVPACLAGVKTECVHLCRVAGNTVWCDPVWQVILVALRWIFNHTCSMLMVPFYWDHGTIIFYTSFRPYV